MINKKVLLIILAGLFLRVVLSILSYPPNTWEYHDLAINLISGKGYVLQNYLGTDYRSAYSGVLYVWLTAVLYYFQGKFLVLITQGIITGFNALLIFSISKKIFNSRVGLIAVFFTMFHPGIMYYDVFNLHPLGFDSLFFTLAFFMFLKMVNSSNFLTYLFAGIVLGVSILQRSTIAFMYFFGLIWFWFFKPKNKISFLKIYLSFSLGVFLVLSPWIMRNYQIHGEFAMATTTAEFFWRGNAPWSEGSAMLPNGKSVLFSAPKDFLESLFSKGELEQSEFFRKTAMNFFWQNPERFLFGVINKFLHFWSFSNQSGISYSTKYFFVYTFYYTVILVLALFGESFIITNRVDDKIKSFFSLLMLFFLTISSSYSFFYLEMRHRWAIEPLLLIVSSVGMNYLLSLRIFAHQKVKSYFK